MEIEMMPHHQAMMYWQKSPPQHSAQFHPYYPPLSTFEQSPQSRSQPIDMQPAFSVNETAIRNGSKKRRACNECKQQKLRCDLSTLLQPTGEDCSRCKRLGLECRIDRSFRRERKRKRSDELEKEVDSLKRELSRRSESIHVPRSESSRQSMDVTGSDAGSTGSVGNFQRPSRVYSTPIPSMASPDPTRAFESAGAMSRTNTTSSRATSESVDMVKAPTSLAATVSRSLGNVTLSADEIDELFAEFFTFYHPFFPILDAGLSPQRCYKSSVLLFWAIISIAARRYNRDPTLLTRVAPCVTSLTWKTLQTIPHDPKVVQSLALLCMWPFPTSSSTSDVSYLWAGSMMNISIQMGLHRPTNPEDFTKYRVQLSTPEISERVRTWAACNIAAQSVSVGSGLAAPTQYDWALVSGSLLGFPAMRLEPEIELRLRIEMFRENVSKSLASNTSDPIGLLPTNERLLLYRAFMKELDAIEGSAADISCTNRFCILAARLHLQSFYLFDEPTSEAYTERILLLYFTALTLVQHTLSTDQNSRRVVPYITFPAYRVLVAASLIILKVLKNDFFSSFTDVESGQSLFHAAVTAIKRISIADNDLPSRLADVLGYLWTDVTGLISGPGKDGLQLKIRSRMSMSVVYDSVCRWRGQFRTETESGSYEDELQDEPTAPLDLWGQTMSQESLFDFFDGYAFSKDTPDYGFMS